MLLSGHQVDVLFTDFSKAFDTIDHNIIAINLHCLGFRNPFLSWLISFISNRKQSVKYNNFYLNYFNVTSGVPLGSHIVLLLFNLFIYDIKLFNSQMLLFADDLKIFRVIKISDDVEKLQNYLNYLCTWCDFNKLYLNISKCNVTTFLKKRSLSLLNYNLNLMIWSSIASTRIMI